MPQKPQRKDAPSPSRAHNGIVQCKPLFAICLQKSTLPSVILNLIQNLSKAQAKTYTDPESTFVASACECGVAVQGDGLQLHHHAVIEPVEKSIYTIRSGFESLKHRTKFFLAILDGLQLPAPSVQVIANKT